MMPLGLFYPKMYLYHILNILNLVILNLELIFSRHMLRILRRIGFCLFSFVLFVDVLTVL